MQPSHHLRTNNSEHDRLKQSCVLTLSRGVGPAAEMECRNFLAKFPESADAHFLLGTCLSKSPRPAKAFPHLERAVAIQPKNPDFLFALGQLYKQFELFEFALPLLDPLVRSHPLIPEFHAALGEIFMQVGQTDRAQKYFETALPLAKQTRLKHEIEIRLLSCLASAGMTNEAAALAARLRTSVELHQRTAVLREAVEVQQEGHKSSVGQEIESLMADKRVPSQDRIELRLLMGRMFDRDGDHDRAFELWEQARELSKQSPFLVQPRQQHYEAYLEFYTPEIFKAVEQYGHDSNEPVFIVGMPRSGTTLTEQIIAAHPDCASVGELKRWLQVEGRFQKDYPENVRVQRMLRNAADGELKARAEETLRYMRLVAGRQSRLIAEKTPHNFQALGFHRLCFPKARFVHCRRHPIDCFISAYQQNMLPSHGYTYDQVEYFKEWHFHDKLMDYWKSLFPGQILTLHYEDLATNPEIWSRKLIAFLGLEWNDSCLNFHESRRSVQTFSKMQVRKPIHTGSVERWRRYEKHLDAIQKAMKEQGFEYRTDGHHI